jgi:hypothetical protein
MAEYWPSSASKRKRDMYHKSIKPRESEPEARGQWLLRDPEGERGLKRFGAAEEAASEGLPQPCSAGLHKFSSWRAHSSLLSSSSLDSSPRLAAWRRNLHILQVKQRFGRWIGILLKLKAQMYISYRGALLDQISSYPIRCVVRLYYLDCNWFRQFKY